METMTLENIGQLIGTIGFPSLVAIILLRNLIGNFNKRLDALDKRLVQLNKSIVMVTKLLNQISSKENSRNPSEPAVDEINKE